SVVVVVGLDRRVVEELVSGRASRAAHRRVGRGPQRRQVELGGARLVAVAEGQEARRADLDPDALAGVDRDAHGEALDARARGPPCPDNSTTTATAAAAASASSAPSAARRRLGSGRRRGTTVVVRGAWVTAAEAARDSSPAVWKRSCGFFARARLITASSAAG